MKGKEYNMIVQNNADSLYRFILSNIKDEHKAQDIVQDSFERLWINHDNIDYSKAKSYLFRIAYNRMIDIIRHDKRMDNVEEVTDNRTEECLHNKQAELKEIINIALSQLSEVQKAVVLLRDYEGYSYDEIAQITDLSESQVKVYIFRARQCLKKFIGKFEEVI